MLISEKTKKVVLNLSNPNRVLTVIPTAQTFEYKGHPLVAVKHGLDETRVLRNLGFPVPSPIKHYYEWPGQFQPFHAQRETAEFLTLNPKAFVLNDMGTGKTLSTLWAFDYLRSIGVVKKALIISPLSTLERTWGDEVFKHFPHLNFAVLYGTKQRRLKLLNEDVDIYLVNHDGVKVLEKELAKRDDIDVVVIDEVASFRNQGTGRWKALNNVISKRDWVWGLTGTPIPNAPTDAWAQCRLISPSRVPKYYGRFRDMVMRQINQFKWVPRDNATQVVAEAMQPSIRFSRDDCVDLPPCIYQTREVEMTPEQKKLYKDMLAKLHMEYAGGQVLAVNEAVKMQKLVQIASGVVYAMDGQNVYVPSHTRIEAVKEVVEEAGTKVIVFVPFKGVLHHVAEQLGKHWECATISGDTPKGQRDDIFAAFQNGKDLRVLIAQPAAMSHGLTLTAASTICWFAPITSNEVYQQANARITRPGQKQTQFIVHIEGSPVEKRIYDRLQTKQSMQGLLLDTVREG